MKHSVLIVEPSEVIYRGLTEIINCSTTFDVLQQVVSAENISGTLAIMKPDIAIINPTLLPVHRHEQGTSPATAPQGIPTVALVYQYVETYTLQHFDAVIDIRDTAGKIVRTLSGVCAAKQEDTTDNGEELSDREKDVLILIAKGMMSKEIADTLNISVHTVISHRKNITRKTGIKSIAGLVAYALLNNLIDSADIE